MISEHRVTHHNNIIQFGLAAASSNGCMKFYLFVRPYSVNVRYQRKYGGPRTFHRMKILAMIVVGIIMITIITEIISRLIATKTKIKQLPQL